MSNNLIVLKKEMQLLDKSNEIVLKNYLQEAEQKLKQSELYKNYLLEKQKYETFIINRTDLELMIKEKMEEDGIEELNIMGYNIKLKKGKKSSKIEIIDGNLIPDEFLRIKKEADKIKIAKSIKEDGVLIPGVELIETTGESRIEITQLQIEIKEKKEEE